MQDDDVEACDVCGYEAELDSYSPHVPGRREQRLCRICANTFIPQAVREGNPDLPRSLAWIANDLTKQIAELRDTQNRLIVALGERILKQSQLLSKAAEDKCEHGVPCGDWCEPCNVEYKKAMKEGLV